MKYNVNDVLVIAAHSAYNVLLVFGVVTLLIGVMMIVNSAAVFRWNQRLSVWVSTRAVLRPLERPRHVNQHIYRRHRVLGALLVLGAVYSLYGLIATYRPEPIVHAYRDLLPPVTMGWLIESLHIFLVGGSVVVLAAGLLLFAAPDKLHAIELWTDGYISGRRVSKPAEELKFTTDAFIRAHPVLIGGLVCLSSLYVLLSLAFFWRL